MDYNNFNIKKVKPATTYEEQLSILKERNLYVESDDFALQILSRVNYYRLSAYLLPFKNSETNSYRDGANFNQIYRLYEFDARIRNLILSMIEPIEILLRTKIAYYHAHNYGPEGYKNQYNFENISLHQRFITEFNSTVNNNDKTPFVNHYIEKYGSHFPVWVAVELFSFGMLSKFYSNMKNEDKRTIAKEQFSTGAKHLTSWLICITELRNRCAHYMRLYYHKLVSFPKLPKGTDFERTGRLFDIIYIMQFLQVDKKRWILEFLPNLQALIDEYGDDINLNYIGFPDNWMTLLNK